MKLFISWSGKQSQALAQVLRDWLPLVLHYVQPWLSEADIAVGERWAEVVAKELETTNFGLLCLTRDNIASPWVLFEAGSLAKSLQGSRVIPLLLDLDFSDISGPLAQFQAKKVDRCGIREIVVSINQAASHPITEDRVEQLFEALWSQLEKHLALLPKQAPNAKPIRSQQEILEELVATVRTLDSKIGQIEKPMEVSLAEEAVHLLRLDIRQATTQAVLTLSSAWYAMLGGNKLEAIRLIRQTTNLGLLEAKNVVESWQEQLRRRQPKRKVKTPSDG